MTKPTVKRCAIYTRKSSEEGLDQEFNSLHAQREACEAYILSQKHEGWELLPDEYDDGGFSGGNMQRPSLKQLIQDIESDKVDIIVVYKVDRLTRSLADFAKLVELMDAKGVSFVSVTQQFNTTTSMGRLTLNVLLSFAQFEREVTGERIRDKIALSKQKGKWMGGCPPMGYRVSDKKLVVSAQDATVIRHIFERYLALQSVNKLKQELDATGHVTRKMQHKSGKTNGGRPFSKGHLYRILSNRVYLGEVVHKEKSYPGEHEAIIAHELFEEVQQCLEHSRVNRSNAAGAKSPCLLAGIIFDDAGNPMSPKHSRTRKRHYRYYTSQAVIQSRVHESGTLPNIPAGEIERVVKSEIHEFFRDSERLQPILSAEPVAKQKELLTIAAEISWNDSEQERMFLRSFIQSIVVSRAQITIRLCSVSMTVALKSILANSVIVHKPDISENNDIILVRKVKLAVTRDGSKVISGQRSSGCNMQLVKAICRSFLWHEQIINGEVSSLKEIQQREDIKSSSYMHHIMQLRYLAPDIIESIIAGNHPAEWTLNKLCAIKTPDWQAQRQQLNLA